MFYYRSTPPPFLQKSKIPVIDDLNTTNGVMSLSSAFVRFDNSLESSCRSFIQLETRISLCRRCFGGHDLSESDLCQFLQVLLLRKMFHPCPVSLTWPSRSGASGRHFWLEGVLRLWSAEILKNGYLQENEEERRKECGTSHGANAKCLRPRFYIQRGQC